MKKRIIPCDVEVSGENVRLSVSPDPFGWEEDPDSGYIECDSAMDAQQTIELLAKPSPSDRTH